MIFLVLASLLITSATFASGEVKPDSARRVNCIRESINRHTYISYRTRSMVPTKTLSRKGAGLISAECPDMKKENKIK